LLLSSQIRSSQDDRASLSTIFPERCASRLQSRRRNDRKPNNRKPNDGKDFGVMPRSLPGLQTGDRHGNHLFSLFCLALEGVIRRRNQLLQFHGMASLTPSTGGFSGPLEIQVVATAGTTAARRDVLQAFPAAPN
jgi:hypothetical protein